LRNLNAHIPINPPELSYLNNALVIPIIAYMNTNYTTIPLNFDIDVTEQELHCSTYPDDAGLWDKISESSYKGFTDMVTHETKSEKIKSIAWTGFDGLCRGAKYSYDYATCYWWHK